MNNKPTPQAPADDLTSFKPTLRESINPSDFGVPAKYAEEAENYARWFASQAPAPADEPSEAESVAACLEDDAALFREEGGWAGEEVADNMDRAAALLTGRASQAPAADERAEFEAWAMQRGLARCDLSFEGSYHDSVVHGMWLGWQARASRSGAVHAALNADQGHPAVQPVEPAACSTADQRSLSEVESLRDCLDSWHDVTAERRRQMEVEGWTPEHDDEHRRGEMASAAAAYAAQAGAMMRLGTSFYDSDPPPSIEWPWARGWWKPGPPRRMLVKAGALILAEIERLDRAATEGDPQ